MIAMQISSEIFLIRNYSSAYYFQYFYPKEKYLFHI